jgi:hypothetical protein
MSVSAYDPLSLQEVLMAPVMKRQQHDQTSAQLGALEAELAKIDPLDVHNEYAKAERAKLADKINQQAELLNKQGYTNNTKGDLLKFNREFQETISPTGTIGQINQAKVVHDQLYKDWMSTEEAKKAGPEVATQRWLEHRKKYADDFGLNQKVKPIGQMVAPKFQDLEADIKDFMTGLGETTKGWITKNGYGFDEGPEGTLIMVTETGKRVTSDNVKQIESATQRLAEKWIKENAPGREWADFTSTDKNYIINQINLAAGSKIKTKVDDSLSTGRTWKGDLKKKEEENSNVPSVTEPVVEFNNNKTNLASSLNKLGQYKPSVTNVRITSTGPGGFNTKESAANGVYTEKDLSKSELEYYDTMYNAMKNSGQIDAKEPKFSKANVTKIQQYIKNTQNYSFSNKILKPTAVDNNLQKPLVFTSKKGTDMNTHLLQEVSSGRRTLIDKDSQKTIDLSKYPNYKVEYVGMVSPDNVLTKNDKTTFNDDSFVLPHVVQITYKEGGVEKRKEVYMDRDSEEIKKPEFKASKTIKNITLKGKQAPGLINKYEDKTLNEIGLKEIESVYVAEQDGYIVKYKKANGETYQETDDNGNPLVLPSEYVQNQIYEMYDRRFNKK